MRVLLGLVINLRLVNFSHDERPHSQYQSTKKCRLEDGSILNAAPDTATFSRHSRCRAVRRRRQPSSDRSTARRLYSCDAVKIFCDKNGKVPRLPLARAA
jgi:hypothetical protein